jgi:cytochrome c5
MRFLIRKPARPADQPSLIISPQGLASAIALSCALSAVPVAASAQGGDRSGREVVDTVCAECHAASVKSGPKIGEGARYAPKIGDEKAWGPLAARGLASLTASALKGIRNMPAHGGNRGLSDIEIERAIVYMVNLAGGKWFEPVSGVTPAVQRKGKEIVDAQCAKCHQPGTNGAPRIGNLTEWIPRLRFGIDFAVRSAIHGHGAMPARGGVVDLTDLEIRAAVNYLINPAAVTATGPAPLEVTVADSTHQIVDGIEVYLGMVPAETLRDRPRGSHEKLMHGGIPGGSDYFHLNVSLFDAKTRAVVTDAQVEVRVAEPVMGSVTKKLQPMTIGQVRSYGNYFRMASRNPYTITVSVRRPGMARTAEAKFDHIGH